MWSFNTFYDDKKTGFDGVYMYFTYYVDMYL